MQARGAANPGKVDIGGWHKTPDPRGWLTACLPRPSLEALQEQRLAELGDRLASLGYTEEAVFRWLGRVPLSQRRFSQAPGYLWRLAEVASPAADLTGFALLRQSLSQARAREIFGDCLGLLEELRLVERQGDLVLPLADLYPCQGAYLFADPKFSAYYRLPNHVYEVGGDSYCLARTTPRGPVRSALDLCTGTGVHAVLAARHSERVQGVDINPRAVEMARINALVNGVGERSRFSLGNLYEPVLGQRFDLMTANTPFVPVPEEEELEAYRAGGESGEEINQRIVEGLSEHLAPGGTLALYTNYPVRQHAGELLDRVSRWLGGGRGWGLAQLHYATSSRDEYIELQIFDWARDTDPELYRRRFRRWIESYERQGIAGMGEGTLLVRRLSDGHPGYRCTLELDYPRADISELVGDWLGALERHSDPAWQPNWSEPLRMHARARAVLEDVRGGPAWVTFAPGWTAGVTLPPRALELLRGVEGESAEQICQRLELSREAARDLLADLGSRMVIADR